MLDHAVGSSADWFPVLRSPGRGDVCGVSLMWGIWLCQHCCREICSECHEVALASLPPCQTRSPRPHDFIQATHFSQEELCAEVMTVQDAMNVHTPASDENVAISIRRGSPAHFTCDIQEPLDPHFFIKEYKGVPCNVIDTSGREEPTTVDQFFEAYDSNKCMAGKMLKVFPTAICPIMIPNGPQDWPPSRLMDANLSQLLFRCLPHQHHSIMTPSGALNLASCYPCNGDLQPDLGTLLAGCILCYD